MQNVFRFFAALLAALLLAAAALPAAHAADPEGGVPRHLLITYRSAAPDRPAFRAHLAGPGRAPFERLVREGALASYQILFNPFNSANTWDAMAILDFRDAAGLRQWMTLERTMPGGLGAGGLKLGRPVDTYAADLGWDGAAPGNAENGNVFYVIPYEYSAADVYRNYVGAYVLPQVEGWMREGVLGRYRIFMNRTPVGKPWDALFVYQYRDLDAFGRRDEVVAKVRATLKDNAAWQELNKIKQSIRTESENTIAELLPAR